MRRENVVASSLTKQDSGTFARTFAIETATREFLQVIEEKKGQIINLGAGSSTLFWRLKSDKAIESSRVTFYEVDFKDTVHAKRRIIESRSELSSLSKVGYVLVSADLRDMKGVQKRLEGEGNLRADLPTLLISECTLMYLPPKESSAVIEWANDFFSSELAFVTYEPFRPEDKYGSMMMKNFGERGCGLMTMKEFPTLESQKARYEKRGFTDVRVCDMIRVFNLHLDQTVIRPVLRLEMFDEFEEWNLIQSHYCFVLALRGRLTRSFEFMKKKKK